MKPLALLFCLSLTIMVQARIVLPAVLGSNMVLQQQSSVKLWGWAGAGEKIYITTSWNNRTDSVTGTPNADWQISVPTTGAGGPYTITLKGSNTIVLDNVMLGEVWICSGQSNMEFNYYYAGQNDITPELPVANNSNIRFFNIPHTTAVYPQDDCRAQWEVSDSNSLKNFSAVGYFFGKKLQQELNVPIGLIDASWGGTPAEVWTPADVVKSNDTLQQAAAKQKVSRWWPITPGYTYNGMIAPVTNFALAGAIWYQGEGNTVAPDTYAAIFKAMIQSWRSQWNKAFPFYFVQIAPFTYGNPYVGALLREQQTKTLSLPHTGMAVITDLVADTTNIHPPNKHDVGARLAAIALSDAYQRPSETAMSPMYQSFSVKGNKITVQFDHAPHGLMTKGKDITELEVAGDDHQFYPAQGRINNNELAVWSKQVPHPVAVRYAFRNAAVGNLFSKKELPVAPFRTDNWPVDTTAVK